MIHLECQSCGRIHYKVNEEEALALKESDKPVEEFSDRDLTRCSKCGLKDFKEVSSAYAKEYLHGGEVYPVLVADVQQKRTTEDP